MLLYLTNHFLTSDDRLIRRYSGEGRVQVVRLLSSWQIGQGDYLRLRDELFAGETMHSPFDKAKAE